jgi:hypothetical protein
MNDTIEKIADGITGLAAVIRKHGTCAPAALDELAARLSTLAAQGGVPVCQRCEGHGVIGYTTGQTPESFEQHTVDCPDCSPPQPAAHVEEAFAREMKGRQYGRQETADARAWFSSGYQAATEGREGNDR